MLENGRRSTGKSQVSVHPPTLAPSYAYLSYDEQVGLTFAQNFTGLAFNVSAVAQTDPSTDVGPAYLLNGLTESGYWYQVGISYNWPGSGGTPLTGFRMNYEVFSSHTPYYCQGSVFPTACGGGIDSLNVNAGDLVQISLTFSGGNVIMATRDWNTSSTGHENYSSEGATHFVGLPGNVSDTNGFFTGLMTEQYYSSPNFGAGEPTRYLQSSLDISAAMMWMDEFDTYPYQPVFSDQTPYSVSFAEAGSFQYFSSHGTAEVANGRELVTGLTPVRVPTLSASTSSGFSPGQRASMTVNYANPSGFVTRITQLKIFADFGMFDVTSDVPSTLGASSAFPATIDIPSSVSNGTYTLTWQATVQFFDTQVHYWVTAQPVNSTSTLTVSGTASTPSNPSLLSIALATVRSMFLPIILPFVLAGIAAAIVAAVVTHRHIVAPAVQNPVLSRCNNCHGFLTQDMLFCPVCGTSASSPMNSATQTGPNVQPPGPTFG